MKSKNALGEFSVGSPSEYGGEVYSGIPSNDKKPTPMGGDVGGEEGFDDGIRGKSKSEVMKSIRDFLDANIEYCKIAEKAIVGGAKEINEYAAYLEEKSGQKMAGTTEQLRDNARQSLPMVKETIRTAIKGIERRGGTYFLPRTIDQIEHGLSQVSVHETEMRDIVTEEMEQYFGVSLKELRSNSFYM